MPEPNAEEAVREAMNDKTTPEEQEAFAEEKMAKVEEFIDRLDKSQASTDAEDKPVVDEKNSDDEKPSEADEKNSSEEDEYSEIRPILDRAEAVGIPEEKAIQMGEALGDVLEQMEELKAEKEALEEATKVDVKPEPTPEPEQKTEIQETEDFIDSLKEEIEEGDISEAAAKKIEKMVKSLEAKVKDAKESAAKAVEEAKVEMQIEPTKARFREWISDLPKDMHKAYGTPGRKPGVAQQRNLNHLWERFCLDCRHKEANFDAKREREIFESILNLKENEQQEEDKTQAMLKKFYEKRKGVMSPPQNMVSGGSSRNKAGDDLRSIGAEIKRRYGHGV